VSCCHVARKRWNFSNDPSKKVSPKKKRMMMLKQLNMLTRAASNLKTEEQVSQSGAWPTCC
jgi:hypothetical protein